MCGWNGEEFNLIGSVEFVEEFYNQLRDQAVAYINIDSAVAGLSVDSFLYISLPNKIENTFWAVVLNQVNCDVAFS